MSKTNIPVSGKEISFGEDELIVSKTDLRGVITYANDVFMRVSGYAEAELLGQPHNLIRHPEMPRCVFRLLWTTISAGEEVFAYVLNRSRTGDGYWVYAHVTPSFDRQGKITGYHSNRRVPHADALAKVRPLYAQLRAEEQRHSSLDAGIKASTALLTSTLEQSGLTYAQFVFGLSAHTCLAHSIA